MSSPDATDFDPKKRFRNRMMLLGLIALFLIPPVLAKLLLAFDVHPASTTNKGELLQPAVALSDLNLQHANGQPMAWHPADRRWQAIVVATPDCAAACAELIAGLDKVWQMQGRHADRFGVLWFGDVPQGAQVFRNFVPMQPKAELEQRLPNLPRSGPPAVYLVDPAGFAALRYAPGFDLSDMYKDVHGMLK